MKSKKQKTTQLRAAEKQQRTFSTVLYVCISPTIRSGSVLAYEIFLIM